MGSEILTGTTPVAEPGAATENVTSAWQRSGRRIALFRKLSSSPVTRRAMLWVFLNVAPPVDRVLVRVTRGRVNTAFGLPVLLLTHTGAKSGTVRETPLGYFDGGDGALVVLASQGGLPKHPAWYFNLLAHPDTEVLLGGKRRPVRARESEGEERQRLWRSVIEMAPNYGDYQAHAGERRIPVMVLEAR
jgi:deazaflavin-dependent oxidoreductase (nitroreductase family)